MKYQWKACATAALLFTVPQSVGCQALPWGGIQYGQSSMTADQYAEHVAANTRYDTTVDIDANYQPAATRSTSAAPSPGPPSLTSGDGSCCH